MGLRFYKRVNYGDGVGLNVSKSGISPSIRTGLGSFGARGYSIRTGIPGLSWRGGTGKNAALVWLFEMLLAGAFLVLYNLIRLLLFLLSYAIHSVFTENGINYRNLGIVVTIFASLGFTIYYLIYWYH